MGRDTAYIFEDSSGQRYTHDDVASVLRSVGAVDCKALFIHTDVTFGIPNPELRRKGYLAALFEVFCDIGVETLFFPAFTFSFNNGENFDVSASKTSMGALAEYVRKQPGVRRSLDPMLSIIGIGPDARILAGMPCRNALGPGSWFDKLHEISDLKFLFFGADFAEYFTYIHHIEKVFGVEYRFDQAFTGLIVDEHGNKFEHEHVINTQCGGIKLKNYAELKSELIEQGLLHSAPLGNLEVACVSEADIYSVVMKKLENEPYGFAYPYTEADLVHEYTFGKDGRRITHC